MKSVPDFPIDGWEFCTLTSESGRERIEDWLKNRVSIGEVKGVRAYMMEILRNLRMVKMELWRRPQFQWFQGAHEGIGEIRFNYKKVEYRMLGCLGPRADQFTLLVGASKRSNSEWDPKNARDSAVEWMRFLGNRPENINAIKIPD